MFSKKTLIGRVRSRELIEHPRKLKLPAVFNFTERKNRTREEVDEITCWLTGYSRDDIKNFLESDLTYGDFFLKAPSLNPNRKLIKGSVCGIKVEEITEPLMQEIRYLDKLVDELAKGNEWFRYLP